MCANNDGGSGQVFVYFLFLYFCISVFLIRCFCFRISVFLCSCIFVFLCFLPASCAIKGMTVDPVKSSIDRRLVRAGKLPIAIKTKKNIKKHETKEKDAFRNNFYQKRENNTWKERKKGTGRKSFLTYEGMHIGMM